jgi:hypothetical protein
MEQELDINCLPPCCNSGCTVCVLDYPEKYLGTIDPHIAEMLEALEKTNFADTEENR